MKGWTMEQRQNQLFFFKEDEFRFALDVNDVLPMILKAAGAKE